MCALVCAVIVPVVPGKIKVCRMHTHTHAHSTVQGKYLPYPLGASSQCVGFNYYALLLLSASIILEFTHIAYIFAVCACV